MGTFISGLVLIFIGIIGEAVSDKQLEDFKKKKIKGGLLETGLWTYSRHPNLFFELVTWIGFGLTGINDNAIELLGFLGPFLLWVVMNFLTIPVTEKHMATTRPQIFKEFCKRTNKFWPFPWFGMPNRLERGDTVKNNRAPVPPAQQLNTESNPIQPKNEEA
jgi:steroid 5-alpha reductase family enzyme